MLLAVFHTAIRNYDYINIAILNYYKYFFKLFYGRFFNNDVHTNSVKNTRLESFELFLLMVNYEN